MATIRSNMEGMGRHWICPVGHHALVDYSIVRKVTRRKWSLIVWCRECQVHVGVTKYGVFRWRGALPRGEEVG